MQEFGWRYAFGLVGALCVVALVCTIGLTVAPKFSEAIKQAEQASRKVRAEVTGPFAPLLREADAAERAKDWPRAIELYSSALAKPPISDEHRRIMLRRRALALEWARRYAESEADWTAALAIEPVDRDLHARRAGFYQRRNRHDEALADFRSAKSFNPTDAALSYGEGRALAGRRDYREAVDAYGEAIRLKPEMMRAWLGRAGAHAQLKMHREARADYDHVIADHEAKGRATKDLPASDITNAYLWRGQMNSHLGDYRRAKDDFDKVLANSQTSNGLKWRGFALERMGEKEQALADYRAALALTEQDKWLSDRIKRLEAP